jgi:hypothetical protein
MIEEPQKNIDFSGPAGIQKHLDESTTERYIERMKFQNTFTIEFIRREHGK